MLDKYTATAEDVFTVLHNVRVFWPNGQYLVRASIAVSGIVKHKNKSEVASKPIKTLLADFLSSLLLAMAQRTSTFPGGKRN